MKTKNDKFNGQSKCFNRAERLRDASKSIGGDSLDRSRTEIHLVLVSQLGSLCLSTSPVYPEWLSHQVGREQVKISAPSLFFSSLYLLDCRGLISRRLGSVWRTGELIQPPSQSAGRFFTPAREVNSRRRAKGERRKEKGKWSEQESCRRPSSARLMRSFVSSESDASLSEASLRLLALFRSPGENHET